MSATILVPAADPEPASGSPLGIPGPLLHGLLLLVALAAFAWIVRRRLLVLRRGAPDPRLDRLGERLRRLLVIGFGQSRQLRYPVAGIVHVLIFCGFLVLLFRSLTLLGQGFWGGFAIPGFAGPVYAAVKDWTGLVMLGCCAVAAYRRLYVKPARYHDRLALRSHGGEAHVILGLIALLMVADAVFEATTLAAHGGRSWALPLASLAAFALEAVPDSARPGLGVFAFWLHNVALCCFGCYLPVSKHFHVITSLPNVFLGKLDPAGRVKPPRHGLPPGAQPGEIGVRRLADFTWKHLLDFFSCTDCGRCSDVCPAYATGAPLSPRQISVKCRDEAYAAHPVFGRPPAGARPELVGGLIEDRELWACTTCRACEDVCPVTIEYVDKIVDMRRFLVDDGRVPAGMQKALGHLEKKGNPYGKPGKKRGEWVAADGGDCGVRVLAAGASAPLCFFTDSATAFDPRIQRIGRAFGRLLRAAGADCGTLGADEVDSGHEARRVGEEGLFESLREQNLQALAAREVGRVVTTDPHALNALRHDYRLGEPVLHHSELLAELIAAGRLRPFALADGRTYTFHDPCYLGRHNGVYEAPRAVLAAIPGLRTVEMAAARNKSFCCGGGSLYLFREGEGERRMGELRIEQAELAGAQVVVTACPFCLINFEDAIKTTGRTGRIEVVDLAELLERALVTAAPPAATTGA
ncbi:MAG: (Fe-S)-binding protein [Planctomycetes bacterium]|nr:(Fe-S)-binding protein [Planctomycetota bacterium]